MKLFKKRESIFLTKEVKHIKCNKCGNTVWQQKTEDDLINEDEFEIKKLWGYCSEWDFEVHKFDICVRCYKKFISSFKISLEKTSYRF